MPRSSARFSLQTFTSQQTKRTFNTFHKLTCKSQHVISLMEGILCKFQYVVKSETPFNLRLNDYRKDINNRKAILARHLKLMTITF